jgi:hypothetical protein
MPHESSGCPHQASLLQRIREADISVSELWLYYFSIGGNCEEIYLDAYLHALMPLPALERMLVELAIDEMSADIT